MVNAYNTLTIKNSLAIESMIYAKASNRLFINEI